MRVRACALNHLDLWIRDGLPALQTPLPFWTGADIAGDVVEVGAGVGGVKVGDRVAVNPNLTCARCEYCHYEFPPGQIKEMQEIEESGP